MASHDNLRLAHTQLPHELHEYVAVDDSARRSWGSRVDNILSSNDLDVNLPLDIGKHQPNPRFDLGKLDALSTDLVQMVLAQTDVQTLFAFRRVNQRAMTMVDALPHFKAITTHCPSVLRGALAIQTGKYFTLQDIHGLLRKAECARCGQFGGYLDLLGFRRTCHACYVYYDDWMPVTAREAHARFGLADEMLRARVRSMKSIPGWYASMGQYKCWRNRLYDPVAARTVALAQYGTAAAIDQATQNVREWDDLMLWGLMKREEQSLGSDPVRHMAIVRAPVLPARPAEAAFWGIRCKPCLTFHKTTALPNELSTDYGAMISNSYRKLYTTKGFVKHVKTLGPMVDGVHTLDGISDDEGAYEADDESDED